MNRNAKDNNNLICRLKAVGHVLISSLQLARSHNPRRHSPERRFRKRFTAGIALAIIVILVGLTTYHLADKRFNRHLTRALHGITGGEVDIGQAEINLLSDIRIRNINVYLPGMPHEPQYLVFSSDDILLEYNPWSIFSRELEVDRIVAIRAILNLSYNKDDKNWNITKLKLKKGDGKRKSFPKVFIRESYIQYRESFKDYLSPPLKQEFSGTVVRNTESNIISFDFNSNDTTSLPDCVISGSYNPDTLELVSKLKFDMEQFASDNLPPNLYQFRLLYDAINPRGELVLKSVYSPSQGNTLTVRLNQASAGINWMGTGAILPLNNVSGEIIVTADETIINSVKVGYTDASFLLTGSVKGYSGDSDIDLRIVSSDMNLPADQWDNFDIMESNIFDAGPIYNYSRDAVSSGSFKSVLRMLVCAMPKKDKKILWETIPTGRIDIDASFERADGRNNVSGDIQLVNTSARHIRFPYHLDGVHGPIHFGNGHISFGPIFCSKDGQHVTVNGKADKNENNKWVIDVGVDVKNITVNEDLYYAFNTLQREVFDLFKPSGNADAFYQIHVVQGQPPRDSIDLNLKDCSGAFKFFPVPASGCFGKVHWEREKTTFTIDQAKIAGGSLQAKGFIATPLEGDSVIDCQIDFEDTKLDNTVAGQLPTLIKNIYDKVKPLGNVSGTAKIRKVFDGHISKTPIGSIKVETIEHDINLHLSEASILLEQFPRKMEHVEAKVSVKDFGLDIIGFDGDVIWPEGVSSVKASGFVDKNKYSLNLSCLQLPFDYEIRELVTDNFPDVIEKYNPTGIFDLKLNAAMEQDQKRNFSAAISPHDMQAVFMDYEIKNLNGEIVVCPDLIVLNNLSIADNSILLDGSFVDNPDRKTIDLKISANDVPVDDNLKNAFGEIVPLLSDEIGLAGLLSCDASLSLDTADPANDMKWYVNGVGSISNGKILLPLETTGINSAFDFSLAFDQVNDNLQLDAIANDTFASILKRPLKKTNAKIRYNSKEHMLNVDIINSEFCGGKLGGRIAANTARSDKSAKIELTMKDCDLRDIVLAKKDKDIKGIVKGYMNLFYSPESKIGNFEFDISEGTLGRLPLIAGILNIINLSLPHEGAFKNAAIVGDIVNEKTLFTQMDFQGSAVSINGKGQMAGPFGRNEQDNGILDVTFLIEAPQFIKPIPVLGSLFNAVRSGFIHVRATGKYDKPVITPIPLSLIGDIFKEYKDRYSN